MPARRLTLPAVATLVLACLGLGVLAALADGDASPRPARAARAAPPAPVAAAAARPMTLVVDHGICGPGPGSPKRPAAAQPVPQGILEAFGVLRRPRAAADALPTKALDALRSRGLEPFDPEAARLLRTTPDGGQAWVVPVRDARPPGSFFVRCSVRPGAAHPRVLRLRPARPAATVPAPLPQRRPGTRATVPLPAPPPAATAPVPAPPGPPAGPRDPSTDPRPGLAVVAIGGAAAGAGGPLEDLVRGRAMVMTASCAGPSKDMMSISGLVPDGVAAAFLTRADGTAVRADVKDNAYTFTIPPTELAAQRYVVWTGGDGTPHVQPVALRPFPIPARRCAAALGVPSVSPDAFALWTVPAPAAVLPAPRSPHRPPHRRG